MNCKVSFRGSLIKNLHAAGNIYTKHVHTGGIIGICGGTTNVTNCRSSVNIYTNVGTNNNYDGTHGGLISCTDSGSTTNITGCLFDGSIVSTNTENKDNQCGGFVGWRNGTINVRNSIVAPSEISLANDSSLQYPSQNFVRNGNANTITNCYYFTPIRTSSNQGQQAHTITAVQDITPALRGTATKYSVSGITAYADNKGLKYGDTIYAGKDDTVKIAPVYTGTPAEGKSLIRYTTDKGTLTNESLTMPDDNVIISALFADSSKCYFDSSTKTLYLNGNLTSNDVQSYKYQAERILVAKGGAVLPSSTRFLFSDFEKAVTIDLAGLDTSNTTDMTGIFERCKALKTINLSGCDTSNVKDMSSMFSFCTELTSVDFGSGINTSSVEDIDNMFSECGSLTTLDLSSFDTAKVTSMRGMFFKSSKLKTIYVGKKWITNNVADSSYIFTSCDSLEGGKGTKFNESNEHDINYAKIDGGTEAPGYFTGRYRTLTINTPERGSVSADVQSPLLVGETVTLTMEPNAWCVLRSLTVTDANNNNVNVAGNQFTMPNSDVTVTAVFDVESDFNSSTGTLTLKGNVANGNEGLILPLGVNKNDVLAINVDSARAVLPDDSSNLFKGLSNVVSIDLTNVDAGSVTNMSNMFSSAKNLTTIYVDKKWTTENVTSSQNMFSGCTKLKGGSGTSCDGTSNIDKTYAVIDKNGQAGYFTGVYSLTLPDIIVIETDASPEKKLGDQYLYGAVVTVRYTGTVPTGYIVTVKANDTSLTEENGVYTVNIGDDITVSADADVASTFDRETSTLTLKGELLKRYSSTSIVLPKGVDKSDVKIIEVDSAGATLPANSSYLFSEFTSATSIDLTNADTSSVTNMSSMFNGCTALTNSSLSGLNTSSVTSMKNMFNGCTALTNPGLSGLNTSSVTDMSGMFYGCTSLTNPGLSGLDTSSVTDMSSMFRDCTALTNPGLSGLDTSSVTLMQNMFRDCTALTNPGLSGLDTSSVTNISSMFYGCTSLTDPGLRACSVSLQNRKKVI